MNAPVSTFRALANLPGPTLTPTASSGSTAATDFTGVLDATTAPDAAGAPGSPLSRLGKPARKTGPDGFATDTEDTGARKRGTSAGDESGSAAVPVASSDTLDITALAQMAATLAPAPSSAANDQGPSTATGAAGSGSAAVAGTAAVAAGTTPQAAAPAAATFAGAGNPASAARLDAAPSATLGAVEAAATPATGSAGVAPTSTPQGSGTQTRQAAAPPPPAPAPIPADPRSGQSAALLPDGTASAEPAITAAAQGPGPAASNPRAVQPAASGPTGAVPPAAAKPGGQARLPGAGLAEVQGSTSDDGPVLDRASKAASQGSGDTAALPDAGVPVATPATADLASAPPATPTQQVIAGLQTLASPAAQQSSRASGAAPADPAATPSSSAVSGASGGVKTLTIQLDPGHLGPVSVTVRMRADAVEIQIAVSNPQALHLLERDRHTLAAAVEALGGTGATLHLGDATGSHDTPSGSQSQSFTSQGGFARQDGSSDAASTGRGRENRSTAAQDASQSESDDPIPAPASAPIRPRDGSLYL